MLRNSYFKEHFRTTTFEIICEGRPLFLNKNEGCSSNTFTESASANQIFQKMLQHFLEHLIWKQKLLKEIILENTSFIRWCITTFRVMRIFAWKKFISKTSKIEEAWVSFIFTFYFNSSMFIYAKNCISQLSVLQFQ